jgi:hypothetical protein
MECTSIFVGKINMARVLEITQFKESEQANKGSIRQTGTLFLSSLDSVGDGDRIVAGFFSFL